MSVIECAGLAILIRAHDLGQGNSVETFSRKSCSKMYRNLVLGEITYILDLSTLKLEQEFDYRFATSLFGYLKL